VTDDGDLGLVGGVVSGGGTQETALARAAAPPTPITVSAFPAVVIGLLGGSFLAGAILSALVDTATGSIEVTLLAWAAMAVLVGRGFYKWQYRKAKEYNDRDYRPKKAVWDRSIMCMRCGAITEQVAPG
jgi:hypothetical protein